MTQVSTNATARARLREPRDEREPGTLGGVPWEHARLFAQLLAVDGERAGARPALSASKAPAAAAMLEALAEQLAPRVLAVAQWPLQAVLYLPRLGRINTTVRREAGTWSIDLEAEQDATARWLSGVRQQCQDRFALALGEPVELSVRVGAA